MPTSKQRTFQKLKSTLRGSGQLSQHVTDIKKKSRKWALSKHLIDKHPEKANDPGCFELKCIKTFKKPLDRQCYEGVMINRSTADIRLNSKAE